MQTEKPILVIKDQPFIIDTALQKLRPDNRPANTIRFSDLQQSGEFYTLAFTGAAARIPRDVIKTPETLSEWACLGIVIRATK